MDHPFRSLSALVTTPSVTSEPSSVQLTCAPCGETEQNLHHHTRQNNYNEQHLNFHLDTDSLHSGELGASDSDSESRNKIHQPRGNCHNQLQN
ncbi:hypothetical protein Q8A67_000030 [Cirrhinus molitorella]|uniref:Uncharacterized protein n=1 Tax=Cirrhinus molitorella TaxID=172907 RepID=A0AA88U6E3_9TELE|nr:hypothetical protein Q8A67_000030 [Cirrhinus molitorella]